MANESNRTPRELHPELERHRTAFRDIQERANALTSDLSDEQALWRPEPGRWSIAECIDHLNQVDGRVVKSIERGIEKAREERLLAPPNFTGEFKHGWLGNAFIRHTEPPVKFRFKAPKPYKPQTDPETPPQEIFQRFEEIQGWLIEQVEEARGLDLARVKMTSPITKLVKFSLGQWFGFIAVHDRRHLWQAEQVREAAEFPGG